MRSLDQSGRNKINEGTPTDWILNFIIDGNTGSGFHDVSQFSLRYFSKFHPKSPEAFLKTSAHFTFDIC